MNSNISALWHSFLLNCKREVKGVVKPRSAPNVYKIGFLWPILCRKAGFIVLGFGYVVPLENDVSVSGGDNLFC